MMKLAGRGTATSAQDAAEVLRGLGVWSPHQHLGPLKAGLTDHFPPDVLVRHSMVSWHAQMVFATCRRQACA